MFDNFYSESFSPFPFVMQNTWRGELLLTEQNTKAYAGVKIRMNLRWGDRAFARLRAFIEEVKSLKLSWQDVAT